MRSNRTLSIWPIRIPSSRSLARLAGRQIDGLVNNAAMATGVGGKNMLDYDPDLWDRVMSVNVKGTWLVTRAAVPLLREGAGIVNVASGHRAMGRAAPDGLRRQQGRGDCHDPLNGARAWRKAHSNQRHRPD